MNILQKQALARKPVSEWPGWFFVKGDLESWVVDQLAQPDPEDVMKVATHLRNAGAVAPKRDGYWINSVEIPCPIESLF